MSVVNVVYLEYGLLWLFMKNNWNCMSLSIIMFLFIYTRVCKLLKNTLRIINAYSTENASRRNLVKAEPKGTSNSVFSIFIRLIYIYLFAWLIDSQTPFEQNCLQYFSLLNFKNRYLKNLGAANHKFVKPKNNILRAEWDGWVCLKKKWSEIERKAVFLRGKGTLIPRHHKFITISRRFWTIQEYSLIQKSRP